jgi:hypothetical protein
MELTKNNVSVMHIRTIDVTSREDTLERMAKMGFRKKEVFFKCVEGLSRRVWDNYDGTAFFDNADAKNIKEEFVRLSKISKVMPLNTAKPIGIAKAGSDIIGYFLERIEGKSLYHYENAKSARLYVKVIDDLAPVMGKLHRVGIGHGDLFVENIMVSLSEQIKLIDPNRSKTEQAHIMDDRIRLSKLQASAESYRNYLRKV